MSKYINITHEGKTLFLNLAEAAELIGMAKSTFSNHWRKCELMKRSEQASFDWIRKRKYKPHNRADYKSVRADMAAVRIESEINSKIKPYLDMFLLGVA